MNAITLVAAEHFSIAQLASLVSGAYVDYYYHVSVSEAQLAQICLEEDVNLAESVVALHGSETVGIALLSRRAHRGWISAVGVLPAFRKQGIARAMISYLQRRAKELALRSVTLEVLAQNHPGLALYAQLGFVRRRELLLLILEPRTFIPDATHTHVAELSPSVLLSHFEAFHPIPPSWQRELATLRHRLPNLQGLCIWEGEALMGYVLFQPQPSYQIIHDLAVLPSATRPLAIAGRLLRAVHQQRPTAGGYVINAVAGDPLLPAYRALNYRCVHRQYELLWESGAENGERVAP